MRNRASVVPGGHTMRRRVLALRDHSDSWRGWQYHYLRYRVLFVGLSGEHAASYHDSAASACARCRVTGGTVEYLSSEDRFNLVSDRA